MLDLKPSRKPALPGGMTFYCTNATVNWSSTFSAGRVDAQCFAPDALLYESWLQANTQCVSLGSLLKGTAKGRQQIENDVGVTDYCSIKHIAGRELLGASKCCPQSDAPMAGVDDLLLAITGATIGKVGIVKRYAQLAFSGDLLCLRVAESIDPHYRRWCNKMSSHPAAPAFVMV